MEHKLMKRTGCALFISAFLLAGCAGADPEQQALTVKRNLCSCIDQFFADRNMKAFEDCTKESGAEYQRFVDRMKASGKMDDSNSVAALQKMSMARDSCFNLAREIFMQARQNRGK